MLTKMVNFLIRYLQCINYWFSLIYSKTIYCAQSENTMTLFEKKGNFNYPLLKYFLDTTTMYIFYQFTCNCVNLSDDKSLFFKINKIMMIS